MISKQDRIKVLRASIKARFLIIDHCLHGWKIRINRSKRCAGLCDYKERTIYISQHYILNPTVTEDEIENVILHEIAHVLTPGEQHSEKWRQYAVAIGCDGKQYLSKHFSVPKYIKSCGCSATYSFRKSSAICRKCLNEYVFEINHHNH